MRAGRSNPGSIAAALSACLTVAFGLFAGGCGGGSTVADSRSAPAHGVVSLVPAVTEMLFAIGAGQQVAGVGSFDNYPPEVRALPRVGALIDPDLERMLSLRPRLVVLYETQTELRTQVESAGIEVFPYRHGSLSDITATLRQIGNGVGRTAEADSLAESIERRIEAVRVRVRGRRLRTLLVFSREPHTLRAIFAAGGSGFLHDMLEAAGCENIFSDLVRDSIQAGTESIIARAPDAVVELRYGTAVEESDEILEARRSWMRMGSLPAVRAGRVHVLVGDEFVVPGPRVAVAVERLARALHPDAFAPE
jgi:iron complex transport system substrate-binding protein